MTVGGGDDLDHAKLAHCSNKGTRSDVAVIIHGNNKLIACSAPSLNSVTEISGEQVPGATFTAVSVKIHPMLVPHGGCAMLVQDWPIRHNNT